MCTSVTIINNRFFIASNSFDDGTKEKNKQLKVKS